MVLTVEQPTLDINSQISALKTQEEKLHKSLNNLRGDRKTVKEYRATDKNLADIVRRRQALEALAQFAVGSLVYKPGTTLSGTITELRVTPGGLGEVWVSWNKGVSIPEQPMNIKYALACEHNFRGIWQADGTLIGYCDCGIMRAPTREMLAHHLDNCRQVRCDYAAKVVDGQPPTFVQAVERIDRQIQWLEEHLLQQSSNVNETPAPDKCGNTHTDNSAVTLGNSSVAALAFHNSNDQQLLPTPEIQERLIDISTGGHDTPQRAPEGDEAHQLSDSKLVDAKDNEYLALEFIAIDGGTQSRAYLNDSTVDEYAEAMDGGAEFPPVLVFYDGEKYWLADGFHRVAAAKKVEWGEIAVTIRSGTRRDAVLYSVGANATHGLRRTNADKRRSVLTLLGDEEWSCWSDREIARRCGVSTPFASKLRSELSVNGLQIDNGELSVNRLQIERKVTRNGTTYTMNATNIGTNEADTFKDEDEAAELPVPKFDARKARTSQEFNAEDKHPTEAVTELPPLTSDEIAITVLSNVDLLSDEQLDAISKAIEVERQKRLTR